MKKLLLIIAFFYAINCNAQYFASIDTINIVGKDFISLQKPIYAIRYIDVYVDNNIVKRYYHGNYMPFVLPLKPYKNTGAVIVIIMENRKRYKYILINK